MVDTRIVVVIGGTSGIGRTIAMRFAEDGWRTVVDIIMEPAVRARPSHIASPRRGRGKSG